MRTYNLSIIVPIYDEIDILEKNLQLILHHFKNIKCVNRFEVIICENGSSDGSANKVIELSKTNDLLIPRIINKKGIGSALKGGDKGK